MDISLEQSHGSVVAYIKSKAVAGTRAYFLKMPQSFSVPSVFFPVPGTTTYRFGLKPVFRTRFMCEAIFFGSDDWQAYENAVTVRQAMIGDGMKIPFLLEDGSEVANKYVEIDAPEIRKIEDGTFSLLFGFNIYQAPDEEEATAIVNVNIGESHKGG